MCSFHLQTGKKNHPIETRKQKCCIVLFSLSSFTPFRTFSFFEILMTTNISTQKMMFYFQMGVETSKVINLIICLKTVRKMTDPFISSGDFFSEENRLQTFIAWPHLYPSPNILSLWGFYSLQEADLVCCKPILT